jgi:hypothetical protein
MWTNHVSHFQYTYKNLAACQQDVFALCESILITAWQQPCCNLLADLYNNFIIITIYNGAFVLYFRPPNVPIRALKQWWIENIGILVDLVEKIHTFSIFILLTMVSETNCQSIFSLPKFIQKYMSLVYTYCVSAVSLRMRCVCIMAFLCDVFFCNTIIVIISITWRQLPVFLGHAITFLRHLYNNLHIIFTKDCQLLCTMSCNLTNLSNHATTTHNSQRIFPT